VRERPDRRYFGALTSQQTSAKLLEFSFCGFGVSFAVVVPVARSIPVFRLSNALSKSM
jgi:hypothetical protein